MTEGAMRLRRLAADYARMEALASASSTIDVQALGDPPEEYLVTYHCRSLDLEKTGNQVVYVDTHRLRIHLHRDYPRRPPQLRWLTEIFHPNILSGSKNGGVCIGGWTPAETLDRLTVRIGEMVQYQNYTCHDALDLEAARWVEQNGDLLPTDNVPLEGDSG